ncbi:hypothetical protein [Brevibacillus sp. HB2.2]|uniref:hypothetical protein n=1 Tax=Brevibacillus sp. HB2.2 TaxID=2738846 RepID=UPI00156AC2C0|nr:hypothetical protein [Brevibacillus sp. HB2.2]NRS50989.1 hypothetical protein [Brevibacillus sp. HB2.2]
MDRKQLLIDAIAGNKEIVAELRDFAENEGHPNTQVMFAVCSEITKFEKQIVEMEMKLNSSESDGETNEDKYRKAHDLVSKLSIWYDDKLLVLSVIERAQQLEKEAERLALEVEILKRA